jgi:4-diphosphocytidyl-2-C-methyl-D-erythritol kinase
MTRTFFAPGKINLCLHVLGRRPDGYHELATLMQRVSLFDRINITVVKKPGVRVFCKGVPLPPGDENIAARAASRLLELAGEQRGVDIVIEKMIPVAAGLGGGSSDAATVFMGLNEMLRLGLARETLMAEGARLGADVPFFIFQDPAWATGIGDILEKIENLPTVWYVLVNPGLAVSTAWVYRNLGLTSKSEKTKLPRFPKTIGDLVGLLHNDLERVVVARFPLIEEIKNRLKSVGAAGALMSGSGATVFGIFEREDAALRAREELALASEWRVFAVRPLQAPSSLIP